MGKLKSFLSKIKNPILNHKKISIPIILILLAILYIIWPKSPKPILTESVKYQDITKSISVTGNIDSDNIANLSFQFGGKLVFIGPKRGDLIKKWQPIAGLDTNQLQASLRQAQQDFTAAKAASDKYYDQNHNDTESYDEKIKRTAIDAAQNKAYDQMAKILQDLNNSTLYAPFDGIITRMDAQTLGVNVTPATIFTVVDPSALVFKMEVDESDIGYLKIGQLAKVSLDSFPNQTLDLKVDSIDFVNHTTSSGGNAYYVKASMPKNESYRIGMAGNTDIIISTKKHVLTIQSSDIVNNNYVYIQMNKKFEKRKVTLGLENDTQYEVLSGINEGEEVALDPNSVPQNLIIK